MSQVSDLKSEVFEITGMTCASCALNVEKALKKENGVENVSVNITTNSALIEYSSNTTTPLELKKAVIASGYDLLIQNSDINTSDKEKAYIKVRNNTIGAIIFSLPVFLVSMFFMDIPYGNWVMLVFTTPIVFWFGNSYFATAYKLAKQFSSNMDTLVALSTGISYLLSLVNMFFPYLWHKQGLHPHLYFESSALVITFVLIGKFIEERAKQNSSSAIKKLISLQSQTVNLIINENQVLTHISKVKKGDLLQVKPGERIPVDGTIKFGTSFIDESSITGEPFPSKKKSGDYVYAGTINQNGSLRLVVDKASEATLLGQIIKSVEKALMTKPNIQKLVDKIAGIFVPVVIIVSILTFIVWSLFGGTNGITMGIISMATVLVIACPCALGLATPTALVVGLGLAAEKGILIKEANVLEQINKIDSIIFDKTGTITEGKPEISNFQWFENESVELNQILFSIELKSEHPIAKSMVEYLSKNNIKELQIENFENISGKGIKANYNNTTYFVGNANLIEEQNIPFNKNSNLIYFADNQKIIATFQISDKIKETSQLAIRKLNELGIDITLLTGDNEQNAKVIADEVGIKNYKANQLPNDKFDYIKNLQAEGKFVAMVGDGINDSQALAQANVSIAMGKGSDIAIDVAQITIVSSDLLLIPNAIIVAKLTLSKIKQNLFWAFIYNIAAIPIAMGVFIPIFGLQINPMIAGAAMALSSISVVGNSLLMKRFKLT